MRLKDIYHVSFPSFLTSTSQSMRAFLPHLFVWALKCSRAPKKKRRGKKFDKTEKIPRKRRDGEVKRLADREKHQKHQSHAIRVIKSIRSLYIYHQSATGRGWRRRSRRCLYHRSWLIMQAMVATFNGFNNGGARCTRDAKGRHKSQE